MGRVEEYRRYARECLEMANASQDPQARATLLQMAQVWLRLADEKTLAQDPEENRPQLDN
jgi:hypothetical protein